MSMYKSWYTKNRKWGITYDIFPKEIKNDHSYNNYNKCYRNGIHFLHCDDGWFMFIVFKCRRLIFYTSLGATTQCQD